MSRLVKNLPAMQETWVWFLGWEDPLEKGMAYPPQYSSLENSMDLIVHGVTKSRTRLSGFHFHFRLASFQLLFSIMEKWKIRMIVGWICHSESHSSFNFFVNSPWLEGAGLHCSLCKEGLDLECASDLRQPKPRRWSWKMIGLSRRDGHELLSFQN